MKFWRAAAFGPWDQPIPALRGPDDGEEDGDGAWDEEDDGGRAWEEEAGVEGETLDGGFRFLHRALTGDRSTAWRAAICWWRARWTEESRERAFVEVTRKRARARARKVGSITCTRKRRDKGGLRVSNRARTLWQQCLLTAVCLITNLSAESQICFSLTSKFDTQ